MCGLICPNFVSKIPYVKSFIYRTFITIINAQSITAICSKMNALTVAWKPSFPDFLATRFFQIRRSFTSFENVEKIWSTYFSLCLAHFIWATKNEHSFPWLVLLTFRHLERLFPLSLVFIQSGNRMPNGLPSRAVFAVHRIHRRISRSVRQRHIHDVL